MKGQTTQNYLKTLFLLLVIILAPAVAWSQQQAYASQAVNMRAGPSKDYPIVAVVSSGSSMTIYGCLQGYKWCDVVVGSVRGWVYSNKIVYPYQGRNVPVLSYGATLGLGIVTFSLGNYWDDHYTDYPWYPQRQNWANRPWLGYGSGYGSGYNWRAPAAQVRPVTPAVRPYSPSVRPYNPASRPPAQVRPVRPAPQQSAPQRAPSAQVRPVRPAPQQFAPQRAPSAQVQGVRPMPPGQNQR